MQKYLNSRRAIGDSVAKLRMIREVLSSALGRAVREELIPRNVAQLTTLPTEHRARRTAWTVAQARTFLAAAIDDPAYPVFVPVKTRAGVRGFPLAPLARAALTAQRARQAGQRAAAGSEWNETCYVFTTRTGRPVEPRNVSRSFDRIVAATGLPRIVFHDLRRTAATMLKGLGTPPVTPK